MVQYEESGVTELVFPFNVNEEFQQRQSQSTSYIGFVWLSGFRLQIVGTPDWRMRGMNGQVDMKKISGVEPLYTLVYGFMKSKDTLTARQQYSQHGSSWVKIPLKKVP